jgi:hypothetical protein
VMVDGLVTGCTTMINKRAKDVSIPIPKEAIVHDRWISIKVAKHGKIFYSSVPCILYRQHYSNNIGSREISVGLFIKNIFHFKRQYLVYRRIYRMCKVADPDFSVWRFIKTKTTLFLTKFIRGL